MRQLISASQIDQWFTPTRRDAQELLPHLVRKLVTATVTIDHLRHVRIPVGDQIGKPGFDGAVSVTSASPYIPVGESVWEMGVSGDAKSKADDDYKKRTANTDATERGRTAFVFVTPRVWADKKNSGENWAKHKRDAGEWKSVYVLDATDLEAWLDNSPAVARWLARQMGIPVQGVVDADGYIKEEFIARYGVEWSPTLVIGGREKSAKSVTDWLTGGSGALKVRGEAVEEAALFVAACASRLAGDAAEATANRCVFVSEPEALDLLTGLGTQHIVVGLSHEVRRRARSLTAPSIRLIAVDGRAAGSRPDLHDVDLERIKRKPSEEALAAMGFLGDRPGHVARASKGSLTALLWMIATEDDEPLPWAGAESGHELIPLLLAGQWASESQSDRAAVGKLAGTDYEQLKIGPLVRWREPLGPLIQRAGVWDWMAWDFAWSLLGKHIDADQVKRFEEVVADVLEEPDPRYELDGDKRWMASIYGKVRKHSDALIGGLAGSIARFAVTADEGVCPNGQGVANRLVRRLLMPQEGRDLRWLPLAKWLPDFAEAAPDEFLEATEALVTDEESATKVFEEERGGIFPHSMHTHLLWALERLAWSPDYLSRTTVILGRLDALDPGGQLANRPKNTLFQIYVPWHPSTSANPERRMNAIRALYDRCPHEAWRLGISLLPTTHSVAMPTAAPRWRHWKPETDVKVTIAEYWQFVENLVASLLKWVKEDEGRWADLLEHYPEVQRGHPDLADTIARALEAVDHSAMAAPARSSLATQLREMLTRHRQFPDADWVLDSVSINRLQTLYDKFAPEDPVQRRVWLFKSWPELPERHADTHDEYEARLLAERRALVEEVYAAEGLAGIRRLADAAERPDEVGTIFALMEANDDPIEDLLREGLSLTPTKDHIPVRLRLAWGIVWRRFKDKGSSWVEGQAAQLRKHIGDHGLVNLASPLPAEGAVWDIVEGWGADAANIYWEKVAIHFLPKAQCDLQRAVECLVRAGRLYRAIDLLGMAFRRAKKKNGGEELILPIDPATVVSLLEDAPRTLPNDEWYPANMSMVGYAVGELLEWLESAKTDDSTLARLEWMWMAVLEHQRRGLVILERHLSTDPKLFVELLKLVFRAKGEDPTEISDEEQARVTQAHRLLEKWSVVPGTIHRTQSDSTTGGAIIDLGLLRQWVSDARRFAKECGRLEICENQIGRVLAYAPQDDDGTWPCEAVRAVIEEVASTSLDQGIHIGEMNKRGVHFRSPGGDQERVLAAKYREYRDKVIDRWPRTGAILDGIRRSYEERGTWYDERDEFEDFAEE